MFSKKEGIDYILNFIRFKKFDKRNNVYLITTDFSTHQFVTKEEFKQIKRKKITSKKLFNNLENTGIILTSNNINSVLVEIKKRYSFLENATSLHIVVPTSRCNLGCTYCFATPDFIGEDKSKTDMTPEIATKTIEFIFNTPSSSVTIEFTGGEALVRFDLVQQMVLEAKELNKKYKKNLQFSVVTNLSLMTKEIALWLIENDVSICTSLDGTKAIHDANRHVRIDKENKNQSIKTYDNVVYWIKEINQIYKEKGMDIRIPALLTTTKNSLGKSKEIIDLYQELENDSIYLRSMGHIGRANLKSNKPNEYTFEDFKKHYTQALNYINELKKTNPKINDIMNEQFKTKILERKPTYNVDFESPWGAATGSLTYFSNGDIYACHEAIGKDEFKLGDIFEHNFQTLFKTKETNFTILSSIIEANPFYDRYVYKSFSGMSPIENYFQYNKIQVHPKKTMKYHEADFFSNEIFNQLYEIYKEENQI